MNLNLHPKVAIGSIVGLLAAVVQGVLSSHGVQIDTTLAGTITAAVSSVAAYFTPSPVTPPTVTYYAPVSSVGSAAANVPPLQTLPPAV